MKIACIIPTFNGKEEFQRLLNSLISQTAKFDIFVIDSSSSDGTFEIAQGRIPYLLSIPSTEFNHGATRQLIIDRYPDYDIYIFLTQDAYLDDIGSISNLVNPFQDYKVGAVCGRQIPHLDATAFAEHARLYNYPEFSQVKSITDVAQLGIKTVFMSNSFAAYRGSALKMVGGFPHHVIFGEDMYVTAKIILANWSVVYSGNAVCRHSHNYTITEEFKRYFDMGVFHAREPWIREYFGGAGAEGLRYVKSELLFLGFDRLYFWPLSIIRNAIKLLAYKIGMQEVRLSLKLKRKLSMHKRYWDGPFSDPARKI